MGAKRKPAAAPPIIREEVLERIGGEEAFLQELLELYDREFALKSKALEKAMRKPDFKAIQELGHGLKGSSANLSLPGLLAAAFDLETAGKEDDIAGARAALARLKDEYARLKAFTG
jgi:HPt (histidine-containing phosphotransfer) domain-containing protein